MLLLQNLLSLADILCRGWHT